MASDPEVLVLPKSLNIKLQPISVPIEGHGSMQPAEPNQQRKIRHVILWTLSSPWMRLEIVSLDIRNRIVDKWESNTCLNWAQLYPNNANTALTLGLNDTVKPQLKRLWNILTVRTKVNLKIDYI